MITIVKGKEKIVCSYKTYEDQYKKRGYLPASEIKKEATKPVASSLKEEKVTEVKKEDKKVEEEKTEEEKIGTKYGVRKRTSAKKED